MALASGGSRKRLSDINVTPFVDVVLVLLVIFMVTAPMMQTGIEVNLPKATLDPIPTNTKPTVVSITARREIYLGDSRFQLDELSSSLVPILAQKKETIYLRADESLPYGLVTSFLSELHRAGIKNISLVTEVD